MSDTNMSEDDKSEDIISEDNISEHSISEYNYNGGLCGLVNFGATCYLNSTLQALINNNYIVKHILKNKYTVNNTYSDHILVKELESLLRDLWNENCIMAPKRFIFEFSQIEKMNLNEQNDPDEFYEKILSRIYEETCILVSDTNNKEWDNNFKNKHSFVNENFYGQYKSEIVCLNCNHNSLTYSPFITLKLEIVNNNMLQCLKSHLSWENNITFTCEKCKCKDKAKKRFTILKIPNVFVVTLKRYTNFGQKKNDIIEYPLLFEIDNIKLELYAIIVHYGSHLFCGHYTSYVKYINNNNWYHIDDNNIEEVNIDTIDKSDVYMLFYKRIN